MNHRPNNKAVGDLKLIFNANLCTGFTRTQLVIKKRFYRNQKHVGMTVVNKVHKQVRNYLLQT